MRSIYETVLYKRSPEEVATFCKTKATTRLYDADTGKLRFQYPSTSKIPFKKWHYKHCLEVNNDFTLGELVTNIGENSVVHLALAILWTFLNVYVYFTKEDYDETTVILGLLVSSLILHSMIYLYFYRLGIKTTTAALIVLFNPILILSLLYLLNITDIQNKDTIKEYMWYVYAGSALLYSAVGFIAYFLVSVFQK